jgi:hypothetical protein
MTTTHKNSKRIEVRGGWTALTPALSPRRGRIIASRSVKRVRLRVSKGDLSCSLSPGERERVRVRADVRTHFEFQSSEDGFYN